MIIPILGTAVPVTRSAVVVVIVLIIVIVIVIAVIVIAIIIVIVIVVVIIVVVVVVVKIISVALVAPLSDFPIITQDLAGIGVHDDFAPTGSARGLYPCTPQKRPRNRNFFKPLVDKLLHDRIDGPSGAHWNTVNKQGQEQHGCKYHAPSGHAL
ncbi:hypothetical protein [uncultured Tateyamaria sp.]|uniref:hypothetical protein n=1 Tax=uncultured Tateyamaria sp. TaxID=455651 RepID=UPI0026174664|nr:hypothetical protein [uncultured Tateyamaria sp.]